MATFGQQHFRGILHRAVECGGLHISDLINERDICCSNKSLVKSQGINKPLLKSHS